MRLWDQNLGSGAEFALRWRRGTRSERCGFHWEVSTPCQWENLDRGEKVISSFHRGFALTFSACFQEAPKHYFSLACQSEHQKLLFSFIEIFFPMKIARLTLHFCFSHFPDSHSDRVFLRVLWVCHPTAVPGRNLGTMQVGVSVLHSPGSPAKTRWHEVGNISASASTEPSTLQAALVPLAVSLYLCVMSCLPSHSASGVALFS